MPKRMAAACAVLLVQAGLLVGPGRVGQAQPLWIRPSPAVEKVVKALATPTAMEFIETPLLDVVEYLKDLHQIGVQIDEKAFRQAKVSIEVPVTVNLKQVSLQSALRLMLRPLDLTYAVQDDAIVITTPKAARSRLVANVYPIGDLVEPVGAGGAGRLDCGTLVAAVTANVSPRTWFAAGGRGTISALPLGQPRYLVVTHNGCVQAEIIELLARLSEVAAGRPGLTEREAKLYDALKGPTTLEFAETPLSDVIDYLKDLHGIEIQLDSKSVGKVGAATDTPISETVKGVPLEAALQRILRKVNLGYVVQDDVLLITSASDAQVRLLPAVYALDEEMLRRLGADARTPPHAEAAVEKIVGSIAPQTWQRAGGRGTVAAVSWGKRHALVVNQTFGVQEQIVRTIIHKPQEPPKPAAAKPEKPKAG
jgi:hypothetical protein